VLPRDALFSGSDLFGHTIHWPSQLCWLFPPSAIARTVVALLFIPHLKEVRDVLQRSAGWLIFRVTLLRALAGLIFSIFPFGQRPEPTATRPHADKGG
jgi:hypothetical protein